MGALGASARCAFALPGVGEPGAGAIAGGGAEGVGAAAGVTRPPGSGPTWWPSAAKEEGFRQAASVLEKAPGGLTSGGALMTRWTGGSARHSARYAGVGCGAGADGTPRTGAGGAPRAGAEGAAGVGGAGGSAGWG